MSLTAAIEEAYAANPKDEVIYETIEIDHVDFAEPFRVINGVLEDTALPLTLGGAPVTFRAAGFEVTLPSVTEDGPQPLRLRIGDSMGYLTQYLLDATQSSEPPTITYRAYTSGDLTQPGEVISGLELKGVRQDAISAEGEVSFREIALQAFPRLTYSAEKYPALQEIA